MPPINLVDELITLALRSDPFIELPSIELGILISETDRREIRYHVEFPTDHNKLTRPQLWTKREWKLNEERISKIREQAEADRIAFDNMKLNISLIAGALSENIMEGILAPDEIMDLAYEVLRANPNGVKALGIDLIEPYYKGVWVELPFRERRFGL